MKTNLSDVSKAKSSAWNLLRSERDEICDLLLQRAERCHQPESLLDDSYADYKALQKRLQSIDSALDRLACGCYATCIACRKELEAEELQADLTLANCNSCLRKTSSER